MRTQVYAALIAVVTAKAAETAKEKVAADKKASELTVKDDITACHAAKEDDGYKKCHW